MLVCLLVAWARAVKSVIRQLVCAPSVTPRSSVGMIFALSVMLARARVCSHSNRHAPGAAQSVHISISGSETHTHAHAHTHTRTQTHTNTQAPSVILVRVFTSAGAPLALPKLDAASVNVDELLLGAAAEAARQELMAVQGRLGQLLQQVRPCTHVHPHPCARAVWHGLM